MIEIETKIDSINKREIENALKKAGAKPLGTRLFRRLVFGLEEKKGEDRFIRLRTDGTKTTLTYKRRHGAGLANTEEIETEVADFEAAAKILSKILKNPVYQESMRTSYSLDGAEISIDEWPMLKPVLEIEASSESKVKNVIRKLGIKGRVLGNISWEKVYALHGINLKRFKSLKLGLRKRKTK